MRLGVTEILLILVLVLVIFGGGKLSIRFVIFKGRFEFSLHFAVLRESVARSAKSLGIKLDKLFCHFLYFGFYL